MVKLVVVYIGAKIPHGQNLHKRVELAGSGWGKTGKTFSSFSYTICAKTDMSDLRNIKFE